MTYRNRKLLDLAHEIPCMAKFPHHCGWPRVQCVPAHSNQQRHGRGHSHKSHDCFFAATCPEAHDYLDGRKGGWSEEEKHSEWDLAHIRTLVYLFETERLRLA